MILEILIFLFVVAAVFLVWNRFYGRRQAIFNMIVLLGVALFAIGVSTGSSGSSFIGLVISIVALIVLANTWFRSRRRY